MTPISPGSLLVKWTAEWCAPCKALAKSGALEALAKELGLTLSVRDVDSKEWREKAEHIRAIPTVEIHDAAGRVLYTSVWMGKRTFLAGLK